MPNTPNEPVARGDRRQEVWIEKDRDQVSKVRHTFPTDDAEVTDTAVMPEDSSAWEAREEDDHD